MLSTKYGDTWIYVCDSLVPTNITGTHMRQVHTHQAFHISRRKYLKHPIQHTHIHTWTHTHTHTRQHNAFHENWDMGREKKQKKNWNDLKLKCCTDQSVNNSKYKDPHSSHPTHSISASDCIQTELFVQVNPSVFRSSNAAGFLQRCCCKTQRQPGWLNAKK